MTSAEIVEEIWENGYIESSMRQYRVSPIYADDLRQHVSMILLTLDNNRLNDIRATGKLPAFIGRIVRNQWHSKTSSFYRIYRYGAAHKAEDFDIYRVADADGAP